MKLHSILLCLMTCILQLSTSTASSDIHVHHHHPDGNETHLINGPTENDNKTDQVPTMNDFGGYDHDHTGHDDHHHHEPHTHHASEKGPDETNVFHLWLYGTASVFLISIFGLMAIMTIPRIASHHHSDILQLLVGLAIGTLTSDALLHLLPHAFSGEHSHSHEEGHHNSSDSQHAQNLKYGLMSLTGIIGFLAVERIITIVSDLCSKSHGNTTKVGNFKKHPEKDHSHHHHHHNHHEHHETLLSPAIPITEKEEKEKMVLEPSIDSVPCLNMDTHNAPLTTEQCHRETMVYQHPDPDRGYVIQLMDHHHHHQHQPGTQKGAKSVIYMIVTGDGLHNFFDGLAIGIAFASGVGGGISTSVAVLCHELPHEVGDFAVLIKAGLAAKKAVMYNTLSAFLCFIGMTVGILVAKMDTGMLSSIIAGMFLYIALVDMIPQLDCCPTSSGKRRAFKLSVQLCGMGIGVVIMSIISFYEPTLQTLLSN